MQFVTFKMLVKSKFKAVCERHDLIEKGIDDTLNKVLSVYDDKLIKATDTDTIYGLSETEIFEIASHLVGKMDLNSDWCNTIGKEASLKQFRDRLVACIASYIDNEACVTTYCAR